MTVTTTLGAYTLPNPKSCDMRYDQVGKWDEMAGGQIVLRRLTTASTRRSWALEIVCTTSANAATVRAAYIAATEGVVVFKPSDTATNYNVRAYGELSERHTWHGTEFRYTFKFTLRESVPT